MANDPNTQCSFCGKPRKQVKHLIAGAGHGAGQTVFICDECVDLCNDVLRDLGAEGREPPPD